MFGLPLGDASNTAGLPLGRNNVPHSSCEEPPRQSMPLRLFATGSVVRPAGQNICLAGSNQMTVSAANEMVIQSVRVEGWRRLAAWEIATWAYSVGCYNGFDDAPTRRSPLPMSSALLSPLKQSPLTVSSPAMVRGASPPLIIPQPIARRSIHPGPINPLSFNSPAINRGHPGLARSCCRSLLGFV